MGKILILLSEELFNNLKENIDSQGDQLNIESLGLRIYDILKKMKVSLNFKRCFSTLECNTKRVKEKAENEPLLAVLSYLILKKKNQTLNIEGFHFISGVD